MPARLCTGGLAAPQTNLSAPSQMGTPGRARNTTSAR